MPKIELSAFDTGLDLNSAKFGGATTGYAYALNANPFTTAEGVVMFASGWTNGASSQSISFYERTTWAVNGTTGRITVSSFSNAGNNALEATEDANGQQVSSYTIALFTLQGRFITIVGNSFKLASTPLATTWQAVQMPRYFANLPNDYWTSTEIINYVGDAGIAPDASDVIKGRTFLSVAPLSASSPIAMGANDPSLGLYRGTYTLAGLPTGIAGQRAKISDSDRGWRTHNGTSWVPETTGRKFDILQFINPASSDNTAGLQAAIDAAQALFGATITFPAGLSIQFASTLDLDQRRNIIFEGTSTNRAETSPPNLIFTGASGNGLRGRSSYGLSLQNMHIQYNNPAYNGTLLEFNHNISGADTQRLNIQNCAIGGTASAFSAAKLINLNQSIIGIVKGNHFQYAAKAVCGREGGGVGNYAYVYEISNNDFNFCDVALWNYDEWTVTGNTFSPDRFGVTRAMDTDGLIAARGLTVIGNYSGDAGTNPVAHYNFVGCLGLTFMGNWVTIPENIGARFVACQAVLATGNRFEGTGTSFQIDNVAGQNYGFSIMANSLITESPTINGIEETSKPTTGYFTMSNEVGGAPRVNSTNYGMTFYGQSGGTPLDPELAITIGSIGSSVSGGDTDGNGAGIRYLLDAEINGMPGGSIIAQPRTRDVNAAWSHWTRSPVTGNPMEADRIDSYKYRTTVPLGTNATAMDNANIGNGEFYLYIDPTTGDVKIKSKTSGGTVKTATITVT